MYPIIKPLLFRLSAERAHHITTASFDSILKVPGVRGMFSSAYGYDHPSLERQVCGLTFKNPVGLAAGFDKNGAHIESMMALGFGFIEVGTVTPRPQVGNPKPRLFRLKKDKAIINRMGFNNLGVDTLVSNLQKTSAPNIIIGGNIGKNKDTPNEEAYKDYLICFDKLYDYVDYFVVNLSSPNTPGLRSLQEKEPLRHLLSQLLDAREKYTVRRPILLKIAPDLTDGQLQDVVEISQDLHLDGLIATNTTIERSPLTAPQSEIEAIGAGGLSGAPLTHRSTQVIRSISDLTNGSLPIIGVGGIHNGPTAKEKIDAGASLVQVYSGLIYEGPTMIKNIKKHLTV